MSRYNRGIVPPTQEDYLEAESPAALGNAYFIHPPPGIWAIKGSHLVETLKELPRSPRSVKLLRVIEARKQTELERSQLEKAEKLSRILRSQHIDEARRISERTRQADLMFGSSTKHGPQAAAATKTIVVAPPLLQKSPVTVDARTFLLARHVALLSSTNKTVAEKGVDLKIANLRLREDIILPPKLPKDASRKGAGRPITPGLATPRSSPPSKKEPSAAAAERAASPLETSSASRLGAKEARREGQARAVRVLLSYFVSTRYVRQLKAYSEHEAIADFFRNSERMTAFLIRWQMRARKCVRRRQLLRLWASRTLVIAAVVRFVRQSLDRKRRRHAARIQQFLGDCLAQCGRVVKIRLFRRRVIVCQRWGKAFVACTRARVHALGIKMARLHVLHAPGSRHAASRFLARCRASFLQERKEHHRRLLESDSTPAFKTIDIYTVRAFLLEEQQEQEQVQPPQYRGRSTLSHPGGPVFLCFSRPHINRELRELARDSSNSSAPLHGTSLGNADNSRKKSVVKIQEPSLSPLSQRKKRERRKKAENSHEDPFLLHSREAQALIKVLQSRVRERTSTL